MNESASVRESHGVYCLRYFCYFFVQYRFLSSDIATTVSFLSFVHVITDAPCTDTPLSGLAVFDYRPLSTTLM